MNARLLARSTPAVTRQTMTPRAAQPMAKRFASSEAIGSALSSERDHHKEHAASEFCLGDLRRNSIAGLLIPLSLLQCVVSFVSSESADLWRKVSLYACIPGCESGRYLQRKDLAMVCGET